MAAGPPSRRQLQAAATQEQLLAAAREVFEEKGYAATTVGAITAAANTAHGTFYLYFRNKEDAFSSVMEAVTAELYQEAGARWAKGDAYASIETSIRGFLEVFVAHRGLWRCLLEGSFANPVIEAMWLGIRQRFVDRIERNLRQLAEGGDIRPLHPALTANALGAMVAWAATTQFVLATPPVAGESFDDCVRTLTDLWFHAVYLDPQGPLPARR
jgi:AcrR family transcriptional regulator